MSQQQVRQSEHEQWLARIHAALLRAGRRAREIARQTGTPVVYVRDGKLVEEYMTDGTEPEADREKSSP